MNRKEEILRDLSILKDSVHLTRSSRAMANHTRLIYLKAISIAFEAVLNASPDADLHKLDTWVTDIWFGYYECP